MSSSKFLLLIVLFIVTLQNYSPAQNKSHLFDQIKDHNKKIKKLVKSSMSSSMFYTSSFGYFFSSILGEIFWFFKCSSQLYLALIYIDYMHESAFFSLSIPASLFEALIFIFKWNSENVGFLFHVQSYNFALLFQSTYFFS